MAGDWKEDAVGTLAAETGLTRDQARNFINEASSLEAARVAVALARALGETTPGAYRHLKDSLS